MIRALTSLSWVFESWTITVKLQWRNQTLDVRSYRSILSFILCRRCKTMRQCDTIKQEAGTLVDLVTTLKDRKWKCYVIRANDIATDILKPMSQEVEAGREIWTDSFSNRTGSSFQGTHSWHPNERDPPRYPTVHEPCDYT